MLVKELYGCDGPQTFQLQKELWKLRRENETLQTKLNQVTLTLSRGPPFSRVLSFLSEEPEGAR